MKILNQYKGLRKEIYVLFACKLIDCMGSMVGPMLTLILSSKLGMSASEIAIFSTIFVIISLPIALFGGKLVDKFNKKLIINIGDITTSLIYIICGIIGINRYTIIAYYIGSMIQEAESTAYSTLCADFSVGKDRERASSLLYWGLNLGLMLSPTLGGLLLENHLSLMFILNGVFQLIGIIIFDIFIKDTSPLIDKNNKYEDSIDSSSTIRIIKENKVILMFMIIFSISMAAYSMYGYLMPLTLANIKGSAGSIYYGTLSSLNCVVVVLCTVPITYIISSTTSINKMIIGNALELLGYLLFIIFIKVPVIYYVAITIFTFGEIVNTISTTPHLTKRIPINYRARIFSIQNVLQYITTAISQIIIGYLYDNTGMTIAWLTIVLTLMLTIIAYQIMKKYDYKNYPDLYETKKA